MNRNAPEMSRMTCERRVLSIFCYKRVWWWRGQQLCLQISIINYVIKQIFVNFLVYLKHRSKYVTCSSCLCKSLSLVIPRGVTDQIFSQFLLRSKFRTLRKAKFLNSKFRLHVLRKICLTLVKHSLLLFLVCLFQIKKFVEHVGLGRYAARGSKAEILLKIILILSDFEGVNCLSLLLFL
jgi:hypothetical protein